jgi:hypothetical protein
MMCGGGASIPGMPENASEDTNAAVWKSEIGVRFWKDLDFVIYGGRRPLAAG